MPTKCHVNDIPVHYYYAYTVKCHVGQNARKPLNVAGEYRVTYDQVHVTSIFGRLVH